MTTRLGFIDHHGPGWWIAELLSTVLLAWPLLAVLLHDPPAWVWAALIGSFACWVAFVALAWRFPRTGTTALAACSVLAILPFGVVGDVVLIMACVSLGVFASHPTPSQRVIIGVTAVDIGLSCAVKLAGDPSVPSILAAIAAMLVMALLGLNRRQYQVQARQTEQLLEQTRRAQHEHARAAALDERARIARELHDVLAHSLGALGVQLEVAEALLSEKDDRDAALHRIRRSRRLAADGLAEARNAVAALRRDVPSLPDALAELAGDHRRDQHTPVSVHTLGTPRPVSSAATVSLLGTAREALTNAAKHAPGAPVTLTLDYREPTVRLRVHNDPADEPARADGGGGFGLTGMRERIALVDGTLTAGRDADAGWLVTAEVPEPGGADDRQSAGREAQDA